MSDYRSFLINIIYFRYTVFNVPNFAFAKFYTAWQCSGSFEPNGDGEIRTHDPLLARQVLSQLSYTPILIWQPPTLPCRLQHSTLGRPGLNLRVRDVDGCFPGTHRHQKFSRY